MSFSEVLVKKISKIIDEEIQNFINSASEVTNYDKNKLAELWGKKDLVKSLEQIDMSDLSIARLSVCSKPELVALCKSKGHRCTGSKDVLINRLLGTEEKGDNKNEKNVSEIKEENTKINTPVKVGQKPTTKSERKDTSIKVVQNLIKTVKESPVRKNAFGNYEHPVTGLVLNKDTKKAYGRQEKDGTVSDLTDDDIQKCKQYKIDYDPPFSLDAGDDTDDIKAVDELDNMIDNKKKSTTVGIVATKGASTTKGKTTTTSSATTSAAIQENEDSDVEVEEEDDGDATALEDDGDLDQELEDDGNEPEEELVE